MNLTGSVKSPARLSQPTLFVSGYAKASSILKQIAKRQSGLKLTQETYCISKTIKRVVLWALIADQLPWRQIGATPSAGWPSCDYIVTWSTCISRCNLSIKYVREMSAFHRFQCSRRVCFPTTITRYERILKPDINITRVILAATDRQMKWRAFAIGVDETHQWLLWKISVKSDLKLAIHDLIALFN